MLTHNTHYATFKVKFSLTLPGSNSPVCFSRSITVPRFSVSVVDSIFGNNFFSTRSRLLEDVRLSIVDFILSKDDTAFDFLFTSQKLDYSSRAVDFLSGLMFRGTFDLTFDHLRYFGSSEKPTGSRDVQESISVRFAVFHCKTVGA